MTREGLLAAERGEGTAPIGRLLERLVREVDVQSLRDWLLTADADRITVAKAWYGTGRVETRQLFQWDGEFMRNYPQDVAPPEWIEAILAAGLMAPVAAAKWIPWTAFWAHQQRTGQQEFVDVSVRRGEKWCRDFVAAADSIQFGQRELLHNSRTIYESLLPLVTAHGLPVPSGLAFVRGWVEAIEAARPNPRPIEAYRKLSCADAFAAIEQDPLLPDIFHHLLASGAAVRLSVAPELAAALVAVGRLDRNRLLQQTIELLTTTPLVGTQRVLAGMLAQLNAQVDDFAGGVALLQGLIATCHGSVGAVLLPLAIEAAPAKEDLVELCVTIAGRAERTQRESLVRALSDGELRTRLGVDAVVAGLTVFRDLCADDLQLATRVAMQLQKLGVHTVRPAAATTPTGLWRVRSTEAAQVPPVRNEFPDPTSEWVGRLGKVMNQEGELAPGRGEPRYEVMTDFCLSLLVRHAATHGPAEVWRAVSSSSWNARAYGPLNEALHHSKPGSYAPSYEDAARLAGTVAGWGSAAHELTRRPDSFREPATTFRYFLAREALLRLGRTPRLLSTPAYSDSTIDFETVVSRLELCQGSSFGPLDLLQTLLRLRPVDPGQLGRLDGLTLPLDQSVSPAERPCAVIDAVAALRTWVELGGFPQQLPVPEDGRGTDAMATPIPLSQFGVLPPRLLDNSPAWGSLEILRVLPLWPQRAVTGHLGNSGLNGLRTAWLHRSMASGPGWHDRLVSLMASPTAEQREAVARLTLELIEAGQLEPQSLAQCAKVRLLEGALSLTRLAPTCDLVGSGGGLSSIWPAALELADTAVVMGPKPKGLADLLALLARYAHEVPDLQVPPNVSAFAAEKATTKAHLQARAVLAHVTPASSH